MSGRLVRYQKCGTFHFVTFSCDRRLPKLGSAPVRDVFEQELDRIRRDYELVIAGYVVMPEHIHLLVGEPRRASLAVALQVLKQCASRRLKSPAEEAFWQRRYYDFNVWTDEKTHGETPLHSSQPGQARTGFKAARLEMVELSPLSDRITGNSGDRVAVDRGPTRSPVTGTPPTQTVRLY